MSSCDNTVTAGYIDLATYDEAETYFYGGPDAAALFVRAFRKANWFTVVPVPLSIVAGTLNFNTTNIQYKVSRGGDYVLNTWIRVGLPQVRASAVLAANEYLRWTHNIGHHLFSCISLSFNDIMQIKYDSYFLDMWAAFTVPAGKQVGYGNMIGNVDQLVNPVIVGAVTGPFAAGPPPTGSQLPAYVLNVPLFLPHCRDHGVALPSAALPYNEVTVNFDIRDSLNLLMVSRNVVGTYSRNAVAADLANAPLALQTGQGFGVWCHYAVVSNDERKKMGKAPRDIIIEQVQQTGIQVWQGANLTATTSQQEVQLRYAQAVKVMFFAARNTSLANEWANYTSRSLRFNAAIAQVEFPPSNGTDPISFAQLCYEGTKRLSMPIDYYALVAPWYFAVTVPAITGYHMYSYSLWFYDVNPKGSTNFGKLTGVSQYLQPTQDAVFAAGGLDSDGLTALAVGYPNGPPGGVEAYSILNMIVNNNICRISGGAMGFPVL